MDYRRYLAVAIVMAAAVPLLAQAQSTCPSLSLGSSGPNVTALQTFFVNAYSNFPQADVTGYFGPITQAAVEEWQSNNGIVSSGTPATTGRGVVGPKTRAAMGLTCTPSSSRAPASAAPSSANQTLIQSLLAKLSVLEAQLAALTSSTPASGASGGGTTVPTPTPTPTPPQAAPTITYVSNSGSSVTGSYANLAVNSQIVVVNQTSGQPVSGISSTVSGSGTVTLSALPLGTFYLEAQSASGTYLAQSVSFTSTGPIQQAPTISSFTASPISITVGQSATLSWSTSNATTLSISGIGTVTASPVTITPQQTTTYTLTATNAQGSVSAQATVTVSPVVNGCTPWPGSDGVTTSASLQAALYADTCVSIAAGTYLLDDNGLAGDGLIIPSNHTLQGAGASNTILKANVQTWKIFTAGDSILTHVGWGPGGDTSGVHISGLTIDGSGIVTNDIVADGMMISNVTITNGRCSAIVINGPGVVLKNSTLTNSAQTTTIPGRGAVNCATRPDDYSGSYGGVQLGTAIYGEGYVFNGTPLRNFAPDIENNTITGNIGPAIDINNVDGGTFASNTVSGNTGWGGVGLFQSSNWQILNNTISHPATDPSASFSEYVYHPDCGPRPSGSGEKTAGIIVCSDASTYGGLSLSPSTGNRIVGNQATGYYGVLLVGAGTASNPALSPYGNDIENNNVYGSIIGCGDSLSPSWATGSVTANTWSGNNCAGTANTPPSYF